MSANDIQIGGSHYKDMGVQPWDVVDTWPLDQRIGYYRGGALKYVMRMGSKDERQQEIGKGIHYLEKLLEILKEEQNALHDQWKTGLQTPERTGGQQAGSQSAPRTEREAEPRVGESGNRTQGGRDGRFASTGVQQRWLGYPIQY